MKCVLVPKLIKQKINYVNMLHMQHNVWRNIIHDDDESEFGNGIGTSLGEME